MATLPLPLLLSLFRRMEEKGPPTVTVVVQLSSLSLFWLPK